MRSSLVLPLLAAAVCLAYAQLLRAPRAFLNYDDHVNFVHNPVLEPHAPVAVCLRRCFTEARLGVLEPAANIAKLAVSRFSAAAAAAAASLARVLGKGAAATPASSNHVTSSSSSSSSSSHSPTLSFWVGVRPFLAATLVLHVVNTIMSAQLAAKLVRTRPRHYRHRRHRAPNVSLHSSSSSYPLLIAAAVALLLVGVHPLHTEVVAWASCFPYALSCCFSLCAAHYHHDGRPVCAGACLVLAVLSKASSVSVFLALLIGTKTSTAPPSDTNPPPSSSRAYSVYATAALYSVSGVLGLGTAVWANENGGGRAGELVLGLTPRIVKATRGFWWYLDRALRPWLPLNILYDLGDLSLSPANTTLVALTFLIIGAAALSLLLRQEKKHAQGGVQADLARTVLQYTIVLAPVLGIVPHGHVTLVADRYAYIPFCLFVVPGVTNVLVHLVSAFASSSFSFSSSSSSSSSSHMRQKSTCARATAAIALAAVAFYLAELTSFQADLWRDDLRLWTHVMRHTRNLAAARGEIALNMASALKGVGQMNRAIAIFEDILGDANAARDGATTDHQEKNGSETIEMFQSKGVAAQAHFSFGNALVGRRSRQDILKDSDRIDRAIRQFEIAARIDPMLSEPLGNLAELFHVRGIKQIHDSQQIGGILSRHDTERGIAQLDQALEYYGKAKWTAESGLTAAGVARRNLIGSRTDPNRVLSSASFWLEYGLCLGEREKYRQLMPQTTIHEGSEADKRLGDGKQEALEAQISVEAQISEEGARKEKEAWGGSDTTADDAYAFFLRSVELKPTDAEAHYQVAKSAKLRGADSAHILHHYQQCVALDPEHVNAIFGMANYLNRQGDAAAAIPYYRQAIAIEPDATDLRINLALALRTVGRDSESLKEARVVLQLDSFHSKATWLVEVLTSKAAAVDQSGD